MLRDGRSGFEIRRGRSQDNISGFCYHLTVLSLRHILQSHVAAMTSQDLLKIERAIAGLSAGEKLWLLERIARQLREPDEAELSEMANDPEIQAEITAIHQEFTLTELDGLQSA
jgi:hypothetical protein